MMDGALTTARRGSNPPDFLVKLLQMVKSEDPTLIAWNGGKVFIQDPVALEKKMSAYFRHSNFSSFQRQLNNFGFRKVEGKGKLAPCMYMHDDLQGMPPDSLLRIRRKSSQPVAAAQQQTNGAAARVLGTSSSWPPPSLPTFPADAKRRRTDNAALDFVGDAAPAPKPVTTTTTQQQQPPLASDDDRARRVATRGSRGSASTRSFDEMARELSDEVELQQRHVPAPERPCFQEPPLEQDDLAADRASRQRDAFESGLLMSFLETDPTAAMIPFFDAPTEPDLAPPPADLAEVDVSDRAYRVNIFGKQHRVLQPAANGAPTDIH
mmetsp:Transcript_8460/g.26376  ORF Transcript_8460/g.26376 Transcript_8460/m.26376 type:complete len:323 (-) Transcript_8460:87-1055(-)